MKEYMRLVQISHPQQGRKVALVREPSLLTLENTASVYELALQAIESNQKLTHVVASRVSSVAIDYDSVYNGSSEWKLLPSFDHPVQNGSCLVSGTGLTHKNSALNRQMMHQAAAAEKLTDSMQMYQWGVEGGHPEKDTIGVQPEWFYKGGGDVLRAHGAYLQIPCFGNDGGEEPEVAGIYVIDGKGKPWRIGFTTGNEFSDHIMEKKNYLYLAPSKLRNCSIGPELVLTEEFQEVNGTVSISRGEKLVWSSEIKSGEKNMAHSLSNLEHHHFKYPGHRIPLQAHVHFFGADAFSFGNQVKLQEEDVMSIQWKGFGRPLQNKLQVESAKETLETVQSIL